MGFQSLYIVRHGDRYDYSYPEWKERANRPGDPPLSDLGHAQARETGEYLNTLLAEDNISAEDVTVLSSPFLRCIQTTNNVLAKFKMEDAHQLRIKPEDSVWEIDSGRNAHSDLPTVVERGCYFPRLDVEHESLFVPDVPEKFPDEFVPRCAKAVTELNKKYTYRSHSVLLVVTHAAGCIALAASAAGVHTDDINAAAPCSITKLSRSSNDDIWELCDVNHGYKDHMSTLGKKTWPWHFSGFIKD